MMVFLLFFKGPSNPAQPLCDMNGKCTQEKLALLTEQLGLNDPVVHQYGIYVGGLFHDRDIDFGATYHCDAPCLGISYRTRERGHRRAAPEVPGDPLDRGRRRSIIYLFLGVFLGVIAARNRGRRSTAGSSPSASSSRRSPTTCSR